MAGHIVVAPDKFKGSLSAADAAAAISRGLHRFDASLDVLECPVADGGEGTLAAAVAAGFNSVALTAPGPTGDLISTALARKGRSAVIEMADVSGLGRLAGGVRKPLQASSRGLGVLVSQALDLGCRHIVIGIGGSACTDGGAGFLAGLGAEITDGHGRPLPDGGGALADAAALDLTHLHPGLRDATVTIACDVDNPLCGPHGAAAVYGPQKGASPEDVAELESALVHWSGLVAQTTARDVRNAPGAGAAGGVGFAAIAVLHAEMRAGIEVVLDLVGLDEHLRGAAAVITGEGCLDAQSLRGKAPIGVGLRAGALGIPTLAIVGRSELSAPAIRTSPFAGVYSLQELEPDTPRAVARASDLLAAVSFNVARERLAALARS